MKSHICCYVWFFCFIRELPLYYLIKRLSLQEPYNNRGQHSPDSTILLKYSSTLPTNAVWDDATFNIAYYQPQTDSAFHNSWGLKAALETIYPNLPSSPRSPFSPGAYSMGFVQAGSRTDQTLLSCTPGLQFSCLSCSVLLGVTTSYFNCVLIIYLKLFKKASTINITSLDTTSTEKVGLEMKGRQKVTNKPLS